MRLGCFEIIGPLPELKSPHAIATLRPWIDAGNVGTLTLERMEKHFGAVDLGSVAKPGTFFDFTRYRPMMFNREGNREIAIPNSTISFAKRENGNDFVFLHLLEPHMFSETYITSVLLVIKMLGVRSYSLLGSMYDSVPHTRPLLITGGAMGNNPSKLEALGIRPGHRYQGPTTICHLITQEAAHLGLETMSLMIHLPQYTELENDYTGELALLQILSILYDFPVGEVEKHKAEKQYAEIDEVVKANRKLKSALAQLEASYDARAESRKEDLPQLSSEVENFLKEMENRFGPT